MADNRYRLTIQFNMNDVIQRDSLNFLGRCGRRKSKIIALAIKELMEKYGLTIEDMDSDETAKFINAYGYMNRKSQENTINTSSVSLKPPEEKKDNSMNEKADKALAAFGL